MKAIEEALKEFNVYDIFERSKMRLRARMDHRVLVCFATFAERAEDMNAEGQKVSLAATLPSRFPYTNTMHVYLPVSLFVCASG
jgi:hypothetical protein